MNEAQHKEQESYLSKAIKYLKITAGVLLTWSFWFVLLVTMLRWVNPPFTAFSLQEDWDKLNRERPDLREQWVPPNELPDHLKLAVVASEDQRFYKHWGLDLNAIDKALEEKEEEGRIRGASTITQQVAKNLFLSPARTYFRKGIEAGISVLIEVLWTKERILEVYLNTAEFGPGMFGVNSASKFYYEKSASELNPEEAAKMATVLPNPKIIEPVPASQYVQDRSQWILQNMEQLSGLAFLPEPKPEPDSTMHLAADTTSVLPSFRRDSVQVINIADSLVFSRSDSMNSF